METGVDLSQLYVMTARIPEAGVAQFNAYESCVLPLLADHGARLERRLRTEDGQHEVHVIWFPSGRAFDEYRNDPRRSQYAKLLVESGAVTTVMRMKDMPL
ncbi:hypothetical protein PCCS19_08270 [Paenibacillus sp. CCS19]|uniref:hypothetical protein n=1 Tax=Paenibacillus sp. CCS19 TaxID=3158387 RepID=UPI002563B327|nr:hypothetical protein [Paenibacillus cellulosilyticus]GMK37773.1 hypothetical protein PCCS19_08270 [Paenibacillus cellulosilyticus]